MLRNKYLFVGVIMMLMFARLEAQNNKIWVGESSFEYVLYPEWGERDNSHVCHSPPGDTTFSSLYVMKSDPRYSDGNEGFDFPAAKLYAWMLSGKAKVYDASGAHLLSKAELDRTLFINDSLDIIDPQTQDVQIRYAKHSRQEDIIRYSIKQEWSIDARGQLNSRVLSITPICIRYDIERSFGGTYPLCEVRFDNEYSDAYLLNDANVSWIELASAALHFSKAKNIKGEAEQAFKKVFPGDDSLRYNSDDGTTPYACKVHESIDKSSSDPYAGLRIDTVATVDSNGNEGPLMEVRRGYNEVWKDRLCLVWQQFYFDEKRQSFNSKVVAAAPYLSLYSPAGDLMGYHKLYYLRYRD
jgi:Gliding motility associated protein GldN